jgi:hypothetical protein
LARHRRIDTVGSTPSARHRRLDTVGSTPSAGNRLVARHRTAILPFPGRCKQQLHPHHMPHHPRHLETPSQAP